MSTRRRSLCLIYSMSLLILIGLLQHGVCAKQVTLTFMTQWWDPERATVIEGLIKEFQEKHPNVKIKLIPEPWKIFDDALTKLFTMAAGGIFPDVLEVRHDLYYSLAAAGLLYDMNDLYKRDASQLTGYWGPSIVNAGKWNGKLMQMPWFGLEGEIWAITYNRDAFDESGLIEPSQLITQNNWDWDSFVGAAVKMTRLGSAGSIERTGVFTMNALNGGLESWLWSFGGGMLNDTGDKCILDSRESITALDFLSSMVKRGVFDFGARLGDWAGIWKTPRFAMAAFWSSVSDHIQITMEGEWPVVQVPFPPGSTNPVNTPVNIHGLGISSKTRQTEEAWEFVKFLLNKKGAYTNIVFRSPKVNMNKYIGTILKRTKPAIRSIYQTQLFSVVHGQLQRVWDQQASPETAVIEAARMCNEVLSKGKN